MTKSKKLKVGYTVSSDGTLLEQIFNIPKTWVWDIYHDRDKNIPIIYLVVWDSSVENSDRIDLIGINKNYFLYVREEMDERG